MKHFKYAYLFLFFIGAIALISGISQILSQAETSRDKIVHRELISCLSAICIDKKSGQQCLELKANIAHIYITEDAYAVGTQRVIIETSNKRCGPSISK